MVEWEIEQREAHSSWGFYRLPANMEHPGPTAASSPAIGPVYFFADWLAYTTRQRELVWYHVDLVGMGCYHLAPVRSGVAI